MSGAPQQRDGYPFTFACKRSGNCCAIPGGFVRVDDAERAAIAAHLGLGEAAFARRYLRADGTTLLDGQVGRCVFLQDGAQAGCGIYAVRPRQCRDWPFWPRVLQEPELLALVRRTCPGIADRE